MEKEEKVWTTSGELVVHRLGLMGAVLRKLAYGQDAQGERGTLVAMEIVPSPLLSLSPITPFFVRRLQLTNLFSEFFSTLFYQIQLSCVDPMNKVTIRHAFLQIR